MFKKKQKSATDVERPETEDQPTLLQEVTEYNTKLQHDLNTAAAARTTMQLQLNREQ